MPSGSVAAAAAGLPQGDVGSLAGVEFSRPVAPMAGSIRRKMTPPRGGSV